nr:DUF1801 domain-containing protein [uncultured Fluviicola sp.]
MAEKKPKLAEIKTKPTVVSVRDFINTIEDEQKRNDSSTLVEMMRKASGEEPVLWGSSIVGFGNKRYRSERSGREVDWFLIGFAPRKANLSLYLSVGIEDRSAVLEQLGKYKTDGGCIYVKKLTDVNLDVLQGMIELALVKNQNLNNG